MKNTTLWEKDKFLLFSHCLLYIFMKNTSALCYKLTVFQCKYFVVCQYIQFGHVQNLVDDYNKISLARGLVQNK